MKNLLRHFEERKAAADLRGKVVFTSARGRTASFEVRGVQIARQLGGAAIRTRHLKGADLSQARALVWITEADPELVESIKGKVPQVLDLVQRWPIPLQQQAPYLDRLDGFIASTPGMFEEISECLNTPKPIAILPHHHCNRWGFRLPAGRLRKPEVVGYVGAHKHLHDAERIEGFVKSKGLRFISKGPFSLEQYRKIDIGIAWTSDAEERQKFQSNIKHANLCSFGIPSVLPAYESYQIADQELGGGSCLFARDLDEFLDQLGRLIDDEALRFNVAEVAWKANNRYSREAITEEYRQAFDEFFGPAPALVPGLQKRKETYRPEAKSVQS